MTNLLSNPEPTFRIGGDPVGALTANALYVCVDETTLGLRTMKLRLLAQGPRSRDDEGLLFVDGDPIDFGKDIEVSLGGSDQERTVFKGVVSAIQADFDQTREPEVQVFAEDKLMQLRMTRRSQTYRNLSDAAIARKVGELNGIEVEADADGPTYECVQQWNQSDLAFLRSRAALIRAEITFRDDKLQFKARSKRQGTEIELVRGNELIHVEMRADLAHQRSEVRVSGYDAGQRAGIEKSAASEAVQAEIEGGRTGVLVLNNAFGARNSMRVRDVPLSDSEADAWARAEQLRRGRSFVRATGMTNGTPDMEVGTRLALHGVGRPFSGAGYYVTHVCHTWDREGGFRTHFDAERPTLSEVS